MHTSSPSIERSAVDRLVANHRAFLQFLRGRVEDPQVAEDILQEAFVRGLSRIDQLRDDESIVAWFYRSLRNAVVDHHRRRATKDHRLDAFARELEATDDPSPDIRDVACQCVMRLAEDLDPKYAEALASIDVRGMAVKDYAVERGITANNAAVRVFRAREALRRQVARSCGTCAAHGCLDCTCGAPTSPRHDAT